MFDDQSIPKPKGISLDMVINPTSRYGSERAEEKKSAFVVNKNVGNSLSSLSRTHGCVPLSCKSRTREQKKCRQHRRRTKSVEISVTSFLVTSSLATQGTLRISSQVAGSGGRPLSDA